MTCFRWLHLTDLHWGTDDHKNLWGSLENQWFDDIDKLKQKTGGYWDAVFFTGDLVNKGNEPELSALTNQLQRLFLHLEKSGPKPFLLVVPGNHDLKRPGSMDLGCKSLTKLWHTDDDIREAIWKKQKNHDCWKTIETAFANYCKWLKAVYKVFPKPPGMKPGLLPGEFAVSLAKDSFQIGVVGLNTAFLQLTEGDFKGKLDAHPAQITELLGQNYQDWEGEHDACFLLTHHPMDWLSKEGKEHFESVIAPPGRFALHLFGHQHDPGLDYIQLGGSPNTRRTACGCSLFSIEKYVDWEKNIQVDRRHGYSAGCLELSDNGISMRLWPRSVVKKQDGLWVFEKDTTFYTKENDGTEPVQLESKRKKGPHVIVTKKEDGLIETLPAGSDDIRALVSGNIRKLLGNERMKRFSEILREHLQEKKIVFLSTETEGLVEGVMQIGVVEAILALKQTVRDFSREVAHEDKKHGLILSTWQDAVSVVGWLVLLCVDEAWLEKEKTGTVTLEIPVKSEAGVEIVVARLNRDKAKLSVEESELSVEVVGQNRINCNPWTYIEQGPDAGEWVSFIKKALWLKIFKKEVPKETAFTTGMNEQLNARLKMKSLLKEPHYLTLKKSAGKPGFKHQLTDPLVLTPLMKDLPDLKLMVLDAGEGKEILLVPEEDLNACLLEFFESEPA